ncbi:MAG: SDR family oxidoreductase [Deinococcota bacterium]
MKLAIFGASGRTGVPLVQQALEQGHTVKALVRSPDKLKDAVGDPLGLPDGLEVIQGDAMNTADIAKTIDGCDVVLSTLGHGKNSPKDMQTVATKHMVGAMKERNIARIISLTGAAVSVPDDQPKVADRIFGFLMGLFAKDVLEDAKNHAEVLRKSDREYIIVRGPRLTEGDPKGTYYVGLVGKESGTQIARADVAHFMLTQLEDDTWLRQAPMVSY